MLLIVATAALSAARRMSHDLKTWEACRDWAVLPLSAPRNRHFLLYSNASEHSLRTCCSRAVDGCASATACRRGFSDCVLSDAALFHNQPGNAQRLSLELGLPLRHALFQVNLDAWP